MLVAALILCCRDCRKLLHSWLVLRDYIRSSGSAVSTPVLLTRCMAGALGALRARVVAVADAEVAAARAACVPASTVAAMCAAALLSPAESPRTGTSAQPSLPALATVTVEEPPLASCGCCAPAEGWVPPCASIIMVLTESRRSRRSVLVDEPPADTPLAADRWDDRALLGSGGATMPPLLSPALAPT